MWKGNDLHLNIVHYERSREVTVEADKSKLPYPMFPSYERRFLYDEYGEVVLLSLVSHPALRSSDRKSLRQLLLRRQKKKHRCSGRIRMAIWR
jgi:hypothetical protein